MQNPGYALTADDIQKLAELKDSPAYANYLRAIANSPAFIIIMKEHINGVDVTQEMKQLISEGRLPETVQPRVLNSLFISALKKMAINIVADTVIVKELETVNVDLVTKDLKKNSDLDYVLGVADEKYYIKAKEQIEEGSVDKDDIIYKGYIAYLSRKKVSKIESEVPTRAKSKVTLPPAPKSKKIDLDIDANDIEL